MDRKYNIKRLLWILGFCVIVFSIIVIFYFAGFFQEIGEGNIYSIVSFVAENAHTGFDKSPGVQLAFEDRSETAKQFAVVVPKKIEQPSAEKPSVAIGEIPRQLFDISLELDNVSVFKIDELNLRVIFTSFGTVPTPVSMTFDILDNSGQIVISATEHVTVETESVFNKNFKGYNLNPGNYTLRLTTIYGAGVKDEFEQPFEVKTPVSWVSAKFYIIGLLGAIVIFILLMPKIWYLIFKNNY